MGAESGLSGSTNDELRQAAEEVTRTESTPRIVDAFDAVTVSVPRNAWLSALAIACAFRAEHPADDELLATPEWAERAGAFRTFDCEPLELFWWIPMVTFRGDKTFVKISFLPDGSTSMGICGSTVMLNPTRGHARRLLSALGVGLVEGVKS